MKYSPSQMLLHAYLTEDGVQLSALVDRFYGSRKPQNAHKSVGRSCEACRAGLYSTGTISAYTRLGVEAA